MAAAEPVYRISDAVAWTEDSSKGELTIVAARMPRGDAHVLSDTSAVIWLSVVEENGRGTAAAISRTAAEMTAAPVEEVRASTPAFLEELVRLGLLEHVNIGESMPTGSAKKT